MFGVRVNCQEKRDWLRRIAPHAEHIGIVATKGCRFKTADFVWLITLEAPY
jgi:hypothetical protein